MVYFRMLDKNQVKGLFGISRREKLSDEEFEKRAIFVINTLGWNNYETKCYFQDVIPFNKRFNPNWLELYNKHLQDPTHIKNFNPIFPEETEEMYFKRIAKEENDRLREQRLKEEELKNKV